MNNNGEHYQQSEEDEALELISGYLDEELTQQEAQKMALMIEKKPEYKKIYDELVVMRHEIQSLSLQDQELAHLDRLFKEPMSKTSRIIGFILVGFSALFIVLFTLFKIFTHPELGLLEKVLVGAIGSGSILLLSSVLKQRFDTAKTDKYKRVKI